MKKKRKREKEKNLSKNGRLCKFYCDLFFGVLFPFFLRLLLVAANLYFRVVLFAIVISINYYYEHYHHCYCFAFDVIKLYIIYNKMF